MQRTSGRRKTSKARKDKNLGFFDIFSRPTCVRGNSEMAANEYSTPVRMKSRFCSLLERDACLFLLSKKKQKEKTPEF